MKKLLRCLGVVGFAFTLLILPSYSFAEVNSNKSELSSMTRQIKDYFRAFENKSIPPATHYYNVGGWKGTLKLDRWYSTGTGSVGYYSGTVTCSGSCAMSKLPNNN